MVAFVARVRAAYPDLVISVDTWRAEVGRAVCEAGADLLNDAWGGADPRAGRRGRGVRRRDRLHPHRRGARRGPARSGSSTTTWSPPRSPTRPPTPSGRSLPASTARSVVIDPAHDFGKNTFHSLELTRRLDEMVATGWPVLVSLSNKDFVGESARPARSGERLTGTLAATAISALRRGADLPGARGGRDPAGRRHGERRSRAAGRPQRAIRGLA